MTAAVTGRAPGLLVFACALVASLAAFAPRVRAAADEGDRALVRVIAVQADVRTGPGFGFRSVYRAKMGEVLPALSRATHDHWFRVELPDGTYGWILGDEVFPLDLDTSAAHEGPSVLTRMGRALFSPSPLLQENVSFSFSVGVLGGDGLFMFRPAWILAPHVSLEGLVGETVGNQVDVVYYGGGFNAFLFARSPVTPFVGAAAGGAYGRKKADQFTIQTGRYSMVNVGGGLTLALKKRLTLRADVRHYVIFDANHTQRIEEYSGALAVHF